MVSALWMSLGTGDTQVSPWPSSATSALQVLVVQARGAPRGAVPCYAPCGAVPVAWSTHGLCHLCRDGSAGPPGAVGWQMGLRTATPRAPTPPWGDLGWEGVTTMLHGAPPAWMSAMGQCHHLCVLRGVGDKGGTPQLSPALAPSCSVPVPRGKRSWWYFCCLARIRSILEAQDAAEPAPPDPQGHPIHRGAPKCRERGPSVPQNPLTAASAGPATSSRIAGASAGSS